MSKEPEEGKDVVTARFLQTGGTLTGQELRRLAELWGEAAPETESVSAGADRLRAQVLRDLVEQWRESGSGAAEIDLHELIRYVSGAPGRELDWFTEQIGKLLQSGELPPFGGVLISAIGAVRAYFSTPAGSYDVPSEQAQLIAVGKEGPPEPAGEQPAEPAEAPAESGFDRVAQLEQQLAQAQARLAELEAKQDHKRELNTARKRRYRQRQREQEREQNAADSSRSTLGNTGQERQQGREVPPSRAGELEQGEETQVRREQQREPAPGEDAQAELDRQRELSNARKQRYRERHREQERQRSAASMRQWRARKQGESDSS